MTTPEAAEKAPTDDQRHYPIPHPDTGEIVRLVSVSARGKLLDSFVLNRWKRETIAKTLATRPDLVALAAASPRDAAEQALNADRSAANTGTAVHSYAEAADAGLLKVGDVPDIVRAHVINYMSTKARYDWATVYSEQTVYNFEFGYAGTFDRILDIPGLGLVVADIKTGKGVYADVALQLAHYAHGEGMWTRTGGHKAMPAVSTDTGVVIHVRDDACVLYVIDLAGAWEVCQALAAVDDWQHRRGVVKKMKTPSAKEISLPAPAVIDVTARALEAETAAASKVAAVFDNSTVLDNYPVPQLAKDRIIKRLRDLDQDLLAEVASSARSAHLPKISAPEFNSGHVTQYQYFLEVAEYTQLRRRNG